VTVETKRKNVVKGVRITVNGAGIPAELLSKIFDPFFTTKPVGDGTGLGLSTSYGIIERHRGTISVESKLNQGTTFTVQIPVRQATTEENFPEVRNHDLQAINS